MQHGAFKHNIYIIDNKMKALYIERKQFGKVKIFAFNLSIETGNFRNEEFIKFFKRKINLLRFLFKNYAILINKILSITIPVERRFGFIIDLSCVLQNMISNSIRENIIYFNNNEITLIENSFLNNLVDILLVMSNEKNISIIIICIGLYKAFSAYVLKIRILIFVDSKKNNL
jgi:hypothetical protein